MHSDIVAGGTLPNCHTKCSTCVFITGRIDSDFTRRNSRLKWLIDHHHRYHPDYSNPAYSLVSGETSPNNSPHVSGVVSPPSKSASVPPAGSEATPAQFPGFEYKE